MITLDICYTCQVISTSGLSGCFSGVSPNTTASLPAPHWSAVQAIL